MSDQLSQSVPSGRGVVNDLGWFVLGGLVGAGIALLVLGLPSIRRRASQSTRAVRERAAETLQTIESEVAETLQSIESEQPYPYYAGPGTHGPGRPRPEPASGS